MYSETDYIQAINFALNFPDDFHFIKYNKNKDLFEVYVFDYDWYNINLKGYYIRSCLKWKGVKKWQI